LSDLADAIAAKRAEIEAAGLCQWGYRTVEDLDREERHRRWRIAVLVAVLALAILSYVAR